MKRMLAALMALLLLCGTAWAEEDWDEGEDWAEEYSAFCRLEGDTLTVLEGVTALGGYIEDYFQDPDDPDNWYTVENPEEEALFEGAAYFDIWSAPDISRVVFPSTLRYLGCEAFCICHFTEFTLPATLEKIWRDAFYACTFDTLRIEAVLPAQQILNSMYDCSVYAFDAPEDHPLYKTADGVLFSKDGKTLLRYPAARKDTHYDVPAGVEHIGEGAFEGAESLKTISLPIGLLSVEDYAFYGCYRLQAVALPLTVREIGKNVFLECVSLELVSLPEGLRAERAGEENGWVEYYPNDAIFRGDNGDTLSEEKDGWDWEWLSRMGQLTGGSRIPLYADEASSRSFASAAEGTIVYLGETRDGRVELRNPIHTTQFMGWADLEHARFLPDETLFFYAGAVVPAGTEIWTEGLPAPGVNMKGRVLDREYIPEDEITPLGPFIRIGGDYSADDTFACRIQDAELTRKSDGTDRVYGVVYGESPYDLIPLLSMPGGELLEELTGGTQIMILAEEEDGCLVRTAFAEGWVAKDHIKIIPETEEGN